MTNLARPSWVPRHRRTLSSVSAGVGTKLFASARTLRCWSSTMIGTIVVGSVTERRVHEAQAGTVAAAAIGAPTLRADRAMAGAGGHDDHGPAKWSTHVSRLLVVV